MMMPASHKRAVAKDGSLSLSSMFSVIAFITPSFCSSTLSPRFAAASRWMMSRTPASCLPPITAIRWLGHVNRKRALAWTPPR